MSKPTVATLMTRDPLTCRADDLLETAAHRMWERDVGALIVVDEREHPVAMITDRDVAMAAYTQGRGLVDVPVAVAMSRDVSVVRVDTTLEAAHRAMQNNRVRRLPVVDDSGQAVGIVTLGDLAHLATPRAEADRMSADVLATLRAVCEPREHWLRELAAQ